MKSSKFSEAQIAFVLKQAEAGTPVAEVCRKAGVAETTFYSWRKRYAGLMPSKVKRRRQLVDELSEVWKVSVRKACHALRTERSLTTYKSKRGGQAALKHRIKQICETWVRYGYRRVHVLLRREAWDVSPKSIYRLYKE